MSEPQHRQRHRRQLAAGAALPALRRTNAVFVTVTVVLPLIVILGVHLHPRFHGVNATSTCASDASALTDLYVATSGPTWTNPTGWNVPSSDPCGSGGVTANWGGVSCSLDSTVTPSCYRVSYLSLSSYGLNGTIPSSIGALSKLG